MPAPLTRPPTPWRQLSLPGSYSVLTCQVNLTWYPTAAHGRWTGSVREPRDRIELAQASGHPGSTLSELEDFRTGVHRLVAQMLYLGGVVLAGAPPLAEQVSRA